MSNESNNTSSIITKVWSFCTILKDDTCNTSCSDLLSVINARTSQAFKQILMKADAMLSTFLSNEGQVTIPFFQRSYVWNSENWDDILSDLLDFEKNHSLSSLILKQLEKQSGKPKKVLVIDGQQRLVTFGILLPQALCMDYCYLIVSRKFVLQKVNSSE